MGTTRLLPAALLLAALAAGPAAAADAPGPTKPARPPGPYLVLVDPGPKDEFLPAAEALATLHGGAVRRFDPARLDDALAGLRKDPPRFVVFVLPPDKIDVDLAHAVLEMATRVDDDPFVDFEYGFVTGRDGPAARRFVGRVEAAWGREFGRTAGLLAAWEGAEAPPPGPLTALKAMGFTGAERCVPAGAPAADRAKAARAALADFKGSDLLLFMSHGYPDAMEGCFRAADLRAWKADLGGAVLVNCACYNGAPGRWFAPGRGGPADRGVVAREDSVALALIDAGVAGYFAGVDPWHGPLAAQVLCHVADDGMRLGEAAKRMYDRLALDFLPGRVRFGPTLKTPGRFAGEGVVNRRHNGAGMIFYGDPALAPYAKTARRLVAAEVTSGAADPLRVRLSVAPLLAGRPEGDSFLGESRLMDYYSVKTADFEKELALEVHRVVKLPAGAKVAPALRVTAARSGTAAVPTGPVQAVAEDGPDGRLLHVRVPIAVRVARDEAKVEALVRRGLVVELEEARWRTGFFGGPRK